MLLSAKEILLNSGFPEPDILEYNGQWPFTAVYFKLPSGKAKRDLQGYFDIFISTRPVTLFDPGKIKRRYNSDYKSGIMSFNAPEHDWSAEWVGYLEGVIIAFSPNVMKNAVHSIFNEEFDELKWRSSLSDLMPSIAYLGLDIYHQLASNFPAGQRLLDEQIKVLLGMLIRRYSQSPIRESSEVGLVSKHVLSAIHFIKSNLKASLNSHEIAESCNISPSHLNKLFRKELGCSLWHYVQQQRLQAAAQDLKSTELSITAIAKSYDFTSRTTFSNSFRQFFGAPPGEYRSIYK